MKQEALQEETGPGPDSKHRPRRGGNADWGSGVVSWAGLDRGL